jgi:hypothetical protein
MLMSEYLDALRERLELPSDYALAARFDVTRSYMSALRKNKQAMSEKMGKETAKILEIHPGLVLLDIERAKAKTPEDKFIWQEIYKGFRLLSLRAKSGRSFALPR